MLMEEASGDTEKMFEAKSEGGQTETCVICDL